MNIKQFIKKAVNNNPFAVSRRKKMKKAIVNDSFSFLCPSCIGGHLYHDLGLQFKSPTINLMLKQPDFVKFALNLDYYLSKELVFFTHEEYSFPCAKLDDITIHFTHYKTREEAEAKWRERSKRINRDNLFVFAYERDGLTKEEIESLAKLNVKGILVFTANKYEDIPFALHLPEYENDGEVGNILLESGLSRKRNYEKHFNFIKWFNEANGGDYDISPYSLIK